MADNPADERKQKDDEKLEAKERHDELTREGEMYDNRIDGLKKEQRILQSEIYQLLGFYFVFQGVLLQGVSHATNCGFAWIPMLLSFIASCAALYGVSSKLYEKQKVENNIHDEKWQKRGITQWVDNYKLWAKGKSKDGFNPLVSKPSEPNPQKKTTKRKPKSLYLLFCESMETRVLCLVSMLFAGLVMAYCFSTLDSACKRRH